MIKLWVVLKLIAVIFNSKFIIVDHSSFTV